MTWPTVTIELGTGGDPTSPYLVLDHPTRGLLDLGTLGPQTGAWSTLSNVTGVHVRRGRRLLTEAFGQDSYTVTFDNLDGALSPHNTASSLYPYVRPEARIRGTVTYGGVDYPLFSGFVDKITPTYGTPSGSSVTITATNAFKVLARYDPAAASSAAGAGDNVATRLARLLPLAGWSLAECDLDTSSLSTMQATTLAQNILTESRLTVDSEGGYLWVAGDGRIVFRDRHSRYEDSVSQAIQATFGDSPGSAELLYEAIDAPDLDADLVRNDISIAAVGSEAATAEDLTSQATYWPRTFNRHDLIFEGGVDEAQNRADAELYHNKTPEQRVDGIVLVGTDGYATLWPVMFGLDISHRVRVIRRPGSGDALDRQLYVEGVEHDIVPGFSFKTRLNTSSATTHDASTFILDSATLGVLDTNTLGTY